MYKFSISTFFIVFCAFSSYLCSDRLQEIDYWICQKYNIRQIQHDHLLANNENYSEILEKHLKTAEDHFQGQKWFYAYHYYCSAERLMENFSQKKEQQSIIFRIKVGREISEAFCGNEFETLANRLSRVHSSLGYDQ
jgi:hypothetical protein